MTLPLPPNDNASEAKTISRDCPATSATSTYVIGTFKQATRITLAELMVDANYAADAANFYAFTLVWGAGPTTAASWSTQASAQGALTAAVPAAMVLAAEPNAVVPAGSVVKLIATKNAAAPNITPRVVINGRVVAL